MEHDTLDWIWEHKVDANGISGKTQVKSGVQLIVIYKFWSFHLQKKKKAQRLQFIYFSRLFPSHNCAWREQGKNKILIIAFSYYFPFIPHFHQFFHRGLHDSFL